MPPNKPDLGRPGKISLLLSDVDGTLVTHDKVLTPRAIEAVEALDEAGIQFTVTSSRPPLGLSRLIAPLDLKLPIGGFNGGALVRPDMTVLETLLLAPEAAQEAIRIIEAHALDPWVYTETEWLVHDVSAPHVAREEFTLSFPAKAVRDFGDALNHVGKLVAVGSDKAAIAQCGEALDAALNGQASATRSQSFFIDVTHPDANKGTLVGTLSRILSIPPEQIATIGDMENDVLMFRKSGLSIAMGNAEPNVKAQAKLVTDTNESDGFAKAVERFLLGQPEVME
jgi:Cof subfamily protein (haloacid dehalogenase superfamily)